MRSLVLLLMVLAMLCNPVFSQKSIPLKAGILAEQISLPTFQDYGSRNGYGFTLGTSILYKEKAKSALLQTVDFHFIYHEKYGSSYVLSSLFDYSIRPGNFSIDIKLGPGYMLFRHYTPLYSPVEGGYEKSSQVQGKFVGMLSISCSHAIGDFRPYLGYTTFVETPFINSYSTLLPHQMLELGIYYALHPKKNDHE